MPMFIIFTFIYPLLIQNYVFFFLSICLYLVFIFVNYFLNLLIVDKKRFYQYVKNYFSTCIAVLFTCIGPLYSLFLKQKVKTER